MRATSTPLHGPAINVPLASARLRLEPRGVLVDDLETVRRQSLTSSVLVREV